jgi:putative peptidoglycan lipid II flippase
LNTTVTRLSRSVFADLFRVGTLATAVKILGAAKVAFTASVFGASGQLDAYLIAFLVPSLFADVLSGSLSAALVPALLRVRAYRGDIAVVSLYQNVLAGSVIALTCVALALALMASAAMPLMAPVGERTEWAYPLLLMLLPVLPLAGAAIVWRALLHAQQRFAVAAAAPGVTPLLSIALLAAFGSDWGVSVLAAGTLFGATIEMLILAAFVRRQGFPVIPRWSGLTADVRDVVSNCFPFVAGTFILGGSIFVDQSFAILLGSGGVAILNYGTKLTTVLLAVGSGSIGAVSLPHLARLAASEKWVELGQAMRRWLYMIWLVSIPVTALLIWFSEPIVRLYLERGAFSVEMAREVAHVQRFSLIQIPLAMAVALVLRSMAALRVSRLFWRVAIATLLVNAIADAVLMRYLGAAGIAAADSIAALVTLTLLARLLARYTAEQAIISPATSSA